MQLLVSIDGDGHFIAAHSSDRKAVYNLLLKIQNGHYYHQMMRDNAINFKNDLSEYCCQEWDELIGDFIQKGILEYVNISNKIPIACKCD